MICTSLTYKTLDEILETFYQPGMEFAEIRLDSCDLSMEEIDYLFSDSDIPLIATCRISEKMSSSQAEAKLIRAIQAGATYVDLEIEAPAMMSKRIRREAYECGSIIIRSYHNFCNTDSKLALESIIEKCKTLGADIIKIATTSHSQEDNNIVLSLYDKLKEKNLIAFCMGELGKSTRIDCLKKGSPFTYSCLNNNEISAPGQLTLLEMSEEIYGNLKMAGYSSISQTEYILDMPCSKSYAQRAIIAASLAKRKSILRNYTACEDNESAIKVAKELGAKITRKKDILEIEGIGNNIHFNNSKLNTGESGFLTRLMIPILAQIGDGQINITGVKTLLSRPLNGAKEMMQNFGVNLDSETVPLTIYGKLKGGEIEINGKGGSQLISGLLYALALKKETTSIRLIEPKSIPYIFMSIDILRKFGIKIHNEMEGDKDFVETRDWNLCEAMNFKIEGNQEFISTEIDLEKDWSTAANFMVAGAIFGKVTIKDLDTTSLQADLSIIDILMETGANMSQEQDTGLIRVQRAPLRPFNIDANNCPDLFPILAILATFCNGISSIKGVSRLINKESNRAETILAILNKMGVKAHINKDKLIIYGETLCQRLLNNNLLKGGNYSAYNDHRIFMALKIAELGAEKPFHIDNEDCINKSFPAFYKMYEKL